MQVEKFSRYELMEELGQGGMATVYRAYDPLFEREVALKILKQELLANPQIRERFERETKIIARLEHAAIVPVYDVGRDKDQLFFVMRYMSGGSLSDRIQNRSMTYSEIAYIIQRVAAALDYAHGKGVIHRDLKPGNILFDEYNNPYISDFGIAKISQASIKLTSSGIIGTPTYMSPEQAQGEEVDGRSDIYSLGVILFEMLSGKTPYEATTPLGMAFKHAAEPVPHILKVNPHLPPGVETVIEKVMAKDRDQRHHSGAEFANDFSAAIADNSGIAAPIPAQIQINAEDLTLPPSTDTRKHQPISRFWMFGGFLILTLAALWGVPRFAASFNPASEPVTATTTSLPATGTPTEVVAPTATATVVAEVTPTSPPLLLPGGADKIALTANKDIFMMDMDGSNILQLTNTNIPKFDLQWLPGGNELLYGERNCIYTINVDASEINSEELACFNDENFNGFRVSPDRERVAISIGNRLLVLPFDKQTLSAASTFELQGLEDLCLDYSDVSVKGALWSASGQGLAITYESVVGQRVGDTIRVLSIDTQRCQAVDPLIMDEFPAKDFLPDGYERYPLLPAYHWDGDERFLFNSFKRNAAYGELYLYDMSTMIARKINPIDGVCCYNNAVFSPDGTHILFVFQDVRRGENSVTRLYYIPIDQINTGAAFTPIRLPLQFFLDLRENIELALRPSLP